jgi:hypothetical protein
VPYNTVTNGTTQITASFWHTNVRDQVCSTFSTAAARSSAITSPAAGLVSVITSGSDQGLYAYHSGSAWAAPWNLPWGVVGEEQAGGTVAQFLAASAGNEADTNLDVTWTAVANRRYVATGMVRLVGTAAEVIRGVITNSANTVISGVFQVPITGTEAVVSFVSPVFTRTAGSQTVKLRTQRMSGSNNYDVAGGGVFIMHLTITDVGPAGAP